AGLLIFGQALSRATWDGATENPTLHSIGMTQGQLFGLSMIRAGIVVVVGVAVGIVVAFLASTFTPFGRLARVAEPNPGFSFDTSFRHLFETPRLYVHNWALTTGSPYLDPSITRKVLQTLEARPEIVDIGEADIREFLQLGRGDRSIRVNAFGFEAVRG